MEGSPSDSTKGSTPFKKTQMSKHPRVRRKVRPRDYPKRPLSAYNIFFKSERPSVLAEYGETKKRLDNGKVDLHEVVKEVGRRWKFLDEEERSKYEDEAEQDTERYRDELRAYQKEKTRERLKEKKRLAALKAAEQAKRDEADNSSHSTEDASIVDDQESTEAETAESGQPSVAGSGSGARSENRVPPYSGENRRQTSATGSSAHAPITEAMLLNGKNEIMARQNLEQERRQHEWAHHQGRVLAAQEGKEVAKSRLIQDLRVLEAARERTIQQLLELDAGEPPAPSYRLVDPRGWEDPAAAANVPYALRASLAGAPGGFGRGRYPPQYPGGPPPPPPTAVGAAGYLGHYVALPPGVRGAVVPDMGGYERTGALLSYPPAVAPARELERSVAGKRPSPAGAGVLLQR
eukprot:Nitzschia sp. Nitz4//scaffold12_size214221//182785//184002//NITZ4_001529-RA/size214221-processed-gene-0.371-mRNA-1//-1//CDS//3329535107//1231//frame0